MAIERAVASVQASSVNGPQTVLRGQHIAGVNRMAAGSFAVHLDEDLVNPNGYAAVRLALNVGTATHRNIEYTRVSRRQYNVTIVDDDRVGQDLNFSIELLSDNDGSPTP